MNRVRECKICNRILFQTKEDYCKSCKQNMKIINGYRFFRMDKYSCGKKAFWVAEHRLVMENIIGRFLDDKENVHHIDGDKLNNDINNLMLFPSNKEHQKFHKKINQFGLTTSILKEIEDSRKKLNDLSLNN